MISRPQKNLIVLKRCVWTYEAFRGINYSYYKWIKFALRNVPLPFVRFSMSNSGISEFGCKPTNPTIAVKSVPLISLVYLWVKEISRGALSTARATNKSTFCRVPILKTDQNRSYFNMITNYIEFSRIWTEF